MPLNKSCRCSLLLRDRSIERVVRSIVVRIRSNLRGKRSILLLTRSLHSAPRGQSPVPLNKSCRCSLLLRDRSMRVDVRSIVVRIRSYLRVKRSILPLTRSLHSAPRGQSPVPLNKSCRCSLLLRDRSMRVDVRSIVVRIRSYLRGKRSILLLTRSLHSAPRGQSPVPLNKSCRCSLLLRDRSMRVDVRSIVVRIRSYLRVKRSILPRNRSMPPHISVKTKQPLPIHLPYSQHKIPKAIARAHWR